MSYFKNGGSPELMSVFLDYSIVKLTYYFVFCKVVVLKFLFLTSERQNVNLNYGNSVALFLEFFSQSKIR